MGKNCAFCKWLFIEQNTGVMRCDNPKALNGHRLTSYEINHGCSQQEDRKYDEPDKKE